MVILHIKSLATEFLKTSKEVIEEFSKFCEGVRISTSKEPVILHLFYIHGFQVIISSVKYHKEK